MFRFHRTLYQKFFSLPAHKVIHATIVKTGGNKERRVRSNVTNGTVVLFHKNTWNKPEQCLARERARSCDTIGYFVSGFFVCVKEWVQMQGVSWKIGRASECTKDKQMLDKELVAHPKKGFESRRLSSLGFLYEKKKMKWPGADGLLFRGFLIVCRCFTCCLSGHHRIVLFCPFFLSSKRRWARPLWQILSSLPRGFPLPDSIRNETGREEVISSWYF